MKNTLMLSKVVCLFFATLISGQCLAQGSVQVSSGTWTGTANGQTVYTGSRMFDAVNAVCNNMGSGTIDVWNSGDSGQDNGGSSVYAIRPQSNQTLDFHDNTVNCNSSGDLITVVYADRKSNITVRNLQVTGNPRYAIWFRGSNNMTFTNIVMNLSNDSPVGLGIRVDNSTASSSNLTINGNININGSKGHAIETYGINGVDIGDITVRNTVVGCGLLLNDSENCTIGTIDAYNCNYGGGYAGFRTANNNGTTHVDALYATHCGRGYFSVSNSSNCTIDYVEITDCSDIGIWLQDATNTHVEDGYVWNNSSCWAITGGSGNSVSVSCSAPGSGGGGSYYSMTNRNTGKCVEVTGGSSSNNADVSQNDCNSGNWRQQWELADNGNGYLLVKNRNSGKCMRAINGNIVQYDCNSSYWSEQFSRQNVGNGYYLIQNRETGTCLRITSSSNGASVILEPCNSTYWSEQFSFSSAGARIAEVSTLLQESYEVRGYPNPAFDTYTIQLPSGHESGSFKLISLAGKVLLHEKLFENSLSVDVAQYPAGIYMVEVETSVGRATHRLIIK